MIRAALLPDRTVIRATGADVTRLLDDLVTVDVASLAPGRARHGALLTPQGKLQFDFFIVKDKTGFLIDVRNDAAEALVARLNVYRLRSDAAFALASDAFVVAAAWSDGAEADALRAPENPPGLTWRDPRLDAMGWRIVAAPHALTTWLEIASAEGTEAGYHAHRIAQGVPEGGRDFDGDAFPHDAWFDVLKGVDFDKGCFVGQEVVSRVKHRGSARKRILPATIEGEAEPGADVTANGRSVGTLGSIANGRALVMLRTDKLTDGASLQAGSAVLTPVATAWAPASPPLRDVSRDT